MSRYGVSAMECVWPLKLQYTWLSGYAPLVRLRTFTSTTFWAAGMVLVSPQNASVPPVGVGLVLVGGADIGVVGGVPIPACTANSHSEYPYGVARAVPFIRM